MENTKEMSRVEQAVYNMREEIKKAVLNEEVEIEYRPSEADGYYAEMNVHIGYLRFHLTIAETFVCYHNDFTKGMFSDKKDFKALTKLVKKHVKQLTPEDIEAIGKLQKQIDEIKRGGAL